MLAVRGVGIRAIALGGNLVIARLLLPSEVGIVAIGASLVVFGDFVANAGVAAALIRRREPPTRADFQSVVGFQLAIIFAFVAAVAAIGLPLGGRGGQLAAIMVASLPVLAFRTPAIIALERNLRYGRIVLVELTDSVVYVAWAVTTVAVGWGVWGLATAVVVRALVGTGVLVGLSPLGIVAPRLGWDRLRPILGFGARFQAIGALNVTRDQGFNLAIAAIAGLTILGLWTLAYRILQTLLLVFHGMWRVSFPAMSRLMEAGEDPRPMIERGIGVVALGSGFFLAPLAASGPALIPSVVGASWTEAADILPAACLGLMIVGPVSVATAGYLYAAGDAATPLRGAVLHTAAQYAVAFSLLTTLRGWALGLAGLAAGIVEAVVLGSAASRRSGAKIVAPLVVPLAAASATGAGGWALATSGRPTFWLAAGVAAGAAAAYLAIVAALRPRLFVDTVRLVRRAFTAS